MEQANTGYAAQNRCGNCGIKKMSLLRIKVIDRYVFLRFVEVFFATFFISSFVLLMQFLWNNLDKIVGKGLGVAVLGEFFFYAALSVVPLALPLAILLASLMTFSNLGEKMELTAMKAAGISLFRIMSSLMVFIFFLAIGAFVFSNNVLPVTQQKLSALVSSLRNTSPELGIPVGEFYSGINGFNIYVREKGKDGKLLKNLMIYDFSAGFENASVTVADSARLKVADDKTYLLLMLYSGESFENLKRTDYSSAQRNVPYRRESFSFKEIIIDFDTNFDRIDDSTMKDRFSSKNVAQLAQSIDSLNRRADSIKTQFAQTFDEKTFSTKKLVNAKSAVLPPDSVAQNNIDSLFARFTKDEKLSALNYALSQAKSRQEEFNASSKYHNAEEFIARRHLIELYRKFTLPFACIVFFFIGAPFGAIIRKGGLGFPAVISVAMFIVYYIIDNSGFKLAREGTIEAWQGMWLSSVCLLPIGIYLTYRAATDSSIMNIDGIVSFFRKLHNWDLKLFIKSYCQATGNVISNSSPPPSPLRTEIVPLWSCTAFFTIDSPRPEPPVSRVRPSFTR